MTPYQMEIALIREELLRTSTGDGETAKEEEADYIGDGLKGIEEAVKGIVAFRDEAWG